jgi:two-component system OmpR family response regulator
MSPRRADGTAESILVVDDDGDIRALLADYLERHGYVVATARNGTEMRAALAHRPFDLVVLDVMMPGDDGLALCRELRARSALPVILLTALAEESDRVVGLEMGADDYLTKPFGARELLARIRAVLRRAPVGRPLHSSDPAEHLVFDGWTLVPARRELLDRDGVQVSLTTGEFDLLLALARHAGRVLSRDELLDLTKGRVAGPFDRSIDVQLSRLRHKIEPDPKHPTLIRTVRGGGYLFTAVVERRTRT